MQSDLGENARNPSLKLNRIDSLPLFRIPMNTIRLHQINQKLDPIINFYANDEDDKKRNPLAVAAGAAAAGGVAYGGYRANQAIRTRQGAMNAVVPGAKTSYASAAQNLYQSGAQKAKIGIESAAKSSGQWMEKLLSKLRGVKLASKIDRLVCLNSALGEVIQFGQGWGATPAVAVGDSSGRIMGVGYRAEKKPGVKEHFKRNAGAYAGGIGVTGAMLTAAALSERKMGGGGFRKALGRVLAHEDTPMGMATVAGAGGFVGLLSDQARRSQQVKKESERRAPLDIARLNRAREKSLSAPK